MSLLVVGSWMLGAVALQDFAARPARRASSPAPYSSIFIATPILAMLKEREPKYRATRQRIERQGARAPASARVAAAEAAALEVSADADTGVVDAPAGVSASGNGAADHWQRRRQGGPVQAAPKPAAGLNHPPRPRKKKRR